mmetsp:Transcript_70201/g.156386  ORF Transcript_70201/g.156386 Transcript_70201/m.156386 type:complete len:232 (-) Transcript_70201:74-769(-)
MLGKHQPRRGARDSGHQGRRGGFGRRPQAAQDLPVSHRQRGRCLLPIRRLGPMSSHTPRWATYLLPFRAPPRRGQPPSARPSLRDGHSRVMCRGQDKQPWRCARRQGGMCCAPQPPLTPRAVQGAPHRRGTESKRCVPQSAGGGGQSAVRRPYHTIARRRVRRAARAVHADMAGQTFRASFGRSRRPCGHEGCQHALCSPMAPARVTQVSPVPPIQRQVQQPHRNVGPGQR